MINLYKLIILLLIKYIRPEVFDLEGSGEGSGEENEPMSPPRLPSNYLPIFTILFIA